MVSLLVGFARVAVPASRRPHASQLPPCSCMYLATHLVRARARARARVRVRARVGVSARARVRVRVRLTLTLTLTLTMARHLSDPKLAWRSMHR